MTGHLFSKSSSTWHCHCEVLFRTTWCGRCFTYVRGLSRDRDHWRRKRCVPRNRWQRCIVIANRRYKLEVAKRRWATLAIWRGSSRMRHLLSIVHSPSGRGNNCNWCQWLMMRSLHRRNASIPIHFLFSWRRIPAYQPASKLLAHSSKTQRITLSRRICVAAQ